MSPVLYIYIHSNVFSVACFFTLLMVSFDEQKLLILTRPNSLIFSFMVKKYSPNQSHENILWCNPEILFFCFLYWRLWSIYSLFLYEGEVKFHFFSYVSLIDPALFLNNHFFSHCCSSLVIHPIHVYVGLYQDHSFFFSILDYLLTYYWIYLTYKTVNLRFTVC